MSTDRYGRTDLVNAVIDGNHDLVRKLLRSGADPNHVDRNGWSALHFAAQKNDATLVGILLKAGADLEGRDGYGNTPLWRAVFSYKDGPDCISTLLAAGANSDAVNEHGVSPSSLAMTIANYDAAKFFRD